jgi:surface polysaccharide O-acyltransferase-like enzyme
MLTGALLLQPSKADEPIRLFFKKRLSRIGVPFLFWAATYFVWSFWVNGKPLNTANVAQTILTGPYYQFWFLYLLLGLYLLTPVLRVFFKHADWRILKYLIFVWFIGTAVIPLMTLFGPYSLNAAFLCLQVGWATSF